MDRIVTHDGVEIGYLWPIGSEWAAKTPDGRTRAYPRYDAACAWLMGEHAKGNR